MISHARVQRMTEEEYLDFEMKSQEKHEFVDGQVFAMVGASRAQNRISINLVSALQRQLKGGPCQAFITELKLRVRAARAFYYPDVVVTCDPGDRDPYIIDRPALVCEVTSPSTEGIDRREKLLAYRQIESLQEYVIVAQNRPRVEVYRRDDSGQWWHDVYEQMNAQIELQSVHSSVTLGEIYDGIELPAGPLESD
jgi:Uma2 family endonuclease